MLKKIYNPIAHSLRSLSVGKYSSVFYAKGKTYHSSVIGGIITLVLMIFFTWYSYSLFVKIFERQNYHLETTSYLLQGL